MLTLRNGTDIALDVQDLSVSFGGAQALRGVSLAVCAGQIVGLVGESGSGKSTLLRAVAHLLSPTAAVEGGSIVFEGVDITHARRKQMNRLRGTKLAYLFQNGEQSLDPLFTVKQQFDEVLRAHFGCVNEVLERTLLRRMGFDDIERVLGALPSELSGGMCQRVALAFALAGSPSLLLADEPTSALDGDAQTRVVNLLRDLNEREGLAILLVSHDIDVVASLASYMVVMRQGVIREEGPVDQVMNHPQDPYTRELIAAIPAMPEGKGDVCFL